MVKVGVIGFQGDVEEYIWVVRRVFENFGVFGDVIWLKKLEQFENILVIIIFGGESIIILRFMVKNGFFEFVKKFGEEGFFIMGICVGLIMFLKEVIGVILEQKFFEFFDVKVNRNVYGRQVDSFEVLIKFVFSGELFLGVFICVLRIVEFFSERVKLIVWFGDRVVGVEQDNIIGFEFYLELIDDMRVYEYFLRKVV